MLRVVPPPTPAAARLERGLRARVAGEVRFDAKSRLLYSTDASNYQILPVGVVVPENADDVEQAVRLAAAEGVPVLPRGGGTGLAGQTVGAALVLDFTKRMHRILEIDPVRRRARVEPGVKLAILNRAASRYGLQFGPDPATIRQCALGGMIGNNSCGARSLVHGKTGDHVHGLRCVLADGERVHLRAVPRARLEREAGREGELLRATLGVLEPERERVLARYPRIPRRVSGYNLDALLEDEEANLARLIVGSEGTLATVVEAEVGLVPVPPFTGLVLLDFRGRFDSMDAIPAILGEPGLSALEIVDDRVIRGARQLLEFRAAAALLSPDAQGVLFCEFTGGTAAEVAELAHGFARRSSRLPGDPGAGVYLDPAAQEAAWALRRASTGLLYRTTPSRDVKPVEFVEDTGVPPEKLGAYTRRFEEIVARHGTTTGYFGHAGQGCLHIRVDLNLKRGADIRRMRAIAEEVAELVVEFGGSLSGEHGDGLSRSEFLPLMFGPEIMRLHREIKAIFDPNGIMNPGKIVAPEPMDTQQRFGADYRATPPRSTWFDYGDDGDWATAVEKCNGMAVCRKLDVGTMCPSYMVTLEEEHTVRGRANALREAMTGALPGMASREVREALDLCLGCKACKTECPVGVDMARYKAEFLAHHHRETGTPRATRFFGQVHRLAALGSRFPRLSNLGAAVLDRPLRRAVGVHPERRLPRLAPVPFRRGWSESAKGDGGSEPVILLDDTFHNFFEPAPLSAAAQVLARAGCRVELPRRQVCCGRALISNGMLDEARESLRHLVETLAPQVEAGALVVGIEPSCILTLRDELPDLLRDTRAPLLAERSRTLEEFLVERGYSPGRLERRAIVHGHCHQKALVGMEPTRELLGRVEGLDFSLLDAGCCGMAGSFGYERGHYEVSRACGERALFPAVREAGERTLVVAPGFSCRHQIADFCDGRGSLHPAELLAMAG